ncbi:PRC-barrel domain-containing protein [Sandaracinobacteroides saxicola]|uniref:PRC-barrel domain-containing protein n=1 Tax=Sandaracinobacteroides saxicola TaxID=2759707 RepID=A0A7G5ILM4_9SPHN|nr:PRC-barrel domain-containing protein [Sandaracinobacteroides saxicola]QMW24266.1 PRC-barrel domain-containing protein [Sandaracinobacteroides saxicola]
MASSYDTLERDHAPNSLISADKVQGTAVYDSSGDKIGSIDSLMIDKESGEVAYAVMSFGGFLGIGERYHPLPWDVLTYDTNLGGYNVGQAAANLKDAPNYSRDEIGDWDDDDLTSRVDDYYADYPRTGYGSRGYGSETLRGAGDTGIPGNTANASPGTGGMGSAGTMGQTAGSFGTTRRDPLI